MLNQKELALLLGISGVHLSCIKNGRKDAGKKLALKLGKRTKTSPSLWTFGLAADRQEAINKLKG